MPKPAPRQPETIHGRARADKHERPPCISGTNQPADLSPARDRAVFIPCSTRDTRADHLEGAYRGFAGRKGATDALRERRSTRFATPRWLTFRSIRIHQYLRSRGCNIHFRCRQEISVIVVRTKNQRGLKESKKSNGGRRAVRPTRIYSTRQGVSVSGSVSPFSEVRGKSDDDIGRPEKPLSRKLHSSRTQCICSRTRGAQ